MQILQASKQFSSIISTIENNIMLKAFVKQAAAKYKNIIYARTSRLLMA